LLVGYDHAVHGGKHLAAVGKVLGLILSHFN
jgi:hypothetical protein